MSRNTSVGMATSYALVGRGSIPHFSTLHSVYTSSGVHPMGTGVKRPGREADQTARRGVD
jgi:hypothetical protein